MKHDRASRSSLFFEDHHLVSHSPPFKKAVLASCLLHLGLLIFLLSQSLFSSSRARPQPKAILVQSVRLSPKPAPLAMRVPEKPKTPPPAPKEEPLPQPPQEELPPQPKPTPQPAPKESPSKEPEECAPKETPKETTLSAPEEKKKETISKPATKEKKPTPPPPAKRQGKKVQTPAPQKAKPQKAKPEKEKSQTVSKEVAKNVESLLAQAKMQRKGMSDTRSGQQKPSSSQYVDPLSDLSFEGKDSQGEEEYGFEATPEEAYIANLIRLIRLSVSLPDKEPVSLKLELFSSGLLKSLIIVSSSSARNRKAVEKGLSSLRYPAFLRAYKGEKKHCFVFKFTREMEWISASP